MVSNFHFIQQTFLLKFHDPAQPLPSILPFWKERVMIWRPSERQGSFVCGEIVAAWQSASPASILVKRFPLLHRQRCQKWNCLILLDFSEALVTGVWCYFKSTAFEIFTLPSTNVTPVTQYNTTQYHASSHNVSSGTDFNISKVTQISNDATLG